MDIFTDLSEKINENLIKLKQLELNRIDNFIKSGINQVNKFRSDTLSVMHLHKNLKDLILHQLSILMKCGKLIWVEFPVPKLLPFWRSQWSLEIEKTNQSRGKPVGLARIGSSS